MPRAALIDARHLTPADARRQPWKNGRGVTEELALWPPHASFERGDFDWRIARAAVSVAGPFSAFPGFERVLVVTEGAGLQLDHGAGAPAARVPRLQPHAFSGDWTSSAALLDGPVIDFNVLARRGAVRVDIRVLRPDREALLEPLGAGQVFLHVVSGLVEVRVPGEETPRVLSPRESLWVIGPARGAERGADQPPALDIAGRGDDCAAILVRIEPAAPPRG